MKLLIDARPLTDPHSGGVKRVAKALTEELLKYDREHDITLLTSGAEKKALPIELGENAKRLHIDKPNKYLSASMSLGRKLESFLPSRFDHFFFPNLGFCGPLKTPYSLLVHDLSFLIEPGWFSRRSQWWHKAVRPRRMIERAQNVFVVSEKTGDDILQLTRRRENIFVIPLATTPRHSSSEAPAQTGRYFFAFGSDDKRKNLACVIEAMKRLKAEPPFEDVKLLVTGTENWNLPWVVALGRPTDAEVVHHIRHAQGLLYPSWYEGFGLPVHEALSLGTPVLATSAGAVPETAPENVKLIQPEKPHFWYLALKSLLENPRRAVGSSLTESWAPAAARILRKTHR